MLFGVPHPWVLQLFCSVSKTKSAYTINLKRFLYKFMADTQFIAKILVMIIV